MSGICDSIQRDIAMIRTGIERARFGLRHTLKKARKRRLVERMHRASNRLRVLLESPSPGEGE